MNLKTEAIKNNPECVDDVTFKDGHLGGCNLFGDPGTECPKMWRYMVNKYNIKSVLDIGCGFGFHLKYFKDFLNLKIKGVEGSEKVQKLSFYPEDIIAHDYSKGSLKIEGIFDLCWSIEFVEHVNSEYKQFFFENFSQCKNLMITHAVPGQGGYHHVNEQTDDYWIKELSEYGFEYDAAETTYLRSLALEDFNDFRIWQNTDPLIRPIRGVSCNTNSEVGYLIPHVAEAGLFFKNKKI